MGSQTSHKQRISAAHGNKSALWVPPCTGGAYHCHCSPQQLLLQLLLPASAPAPAAAAAAAPAASAALAAAAAAANCCCHLLLLLLLLLLLALLLLLLLTASAVTAELLPMPLATATAADCYCKSPPLWGGATRRALARPARAHGSHCAHGLAPARGMQRPGNALAKIQLIAVRMPAGEPRGPRGEPQCRWVCMLSREEE